MQARLQANLLVFDQVGEGHGRERAFPPFRDAQPPPLARRFCSRFCPVYSLFKPLLPFPPLFAFSCVPYADLGRDEFRPAFIVLLVFELRLWCSKGQVAESRLLRTAIIKQSRARNA